MSRRSLFRSRNSRFLYRMPFKASGSAVPLLFLCRVAMINRRGHYSSHALISMARMTRQRKGHRRAAVLGERDSGRFLREATIYAFESGEQGHSIDYIDYIPHHPTLLGSQRRLLGIPQGGAAAQVGARRTSRFKSTSEGCATSVSQSERRSTSRSGAAVVSRRAHVVSLRWRRHPRCDHVQYKPTPGIGQSMYASHRVRRALLRTSPVGSQILPATSRNVRAVC